jgi:hypothetical protein
MTLALLSIEFVSHVNVTGFPESKDASFAGEINTGISET